MFKISSRSFRSNFEIFSFQHIKMVSLYFLLLLSAYELLKINYPNDMSGFKVNRNSIVRYRENAHSTIIFIFSHTTTFSYLLVSMYNTYTLLHHPTTTTLSLSHSQYKYILFFSSLYYKSHYTTLFHI